MLRKLVLVWFIGFQFIAVSPSLGINSNQNQISPKVVICVPNSERSKNLYREGGDWVGLYDASGLAKFAGDNLTPKSVIVEIYKVDKGKKTEKRYADTLRGDETKSRIDINGNTVVVLKHLNGIGALRETKSETFKGATFNIYAHSNKVKKSKKNLWISIKCNPS